VSLCFDLCRTYLTSGFSGSIELLDSEFDRRYPIRVPTSLIFFANSSLSCRIIDEVCPVFVYIPDTQCWWRTFQDFTSSSGNCRRAFLGSKTRCGEEDMDGSTETFDVGGQDLHRPRETVDVRTGPRQDRARKSCT